MEDPNIYNEWRIKDLEEENAKLKGKIILLGDLIFKARNLAKAVVNSPISQNYVYEIAKDFLETWND